MDADTTPATPVAKPTPYATRGQYEEAINAAGLTWTEQSGFLKVVAAGGKIYVAATKTVRRVDLSFEMDLSQQLTKLPHCGQFGAIKQQMVVGTGAEGDLERFQEVLTHLVTLPAPAPSVKPVKAPKAKKAKAVSQPVPTPPAPAAEVNPRLDLIRAAAERMAEAAE